MELFESRRIIAYSLLATVLLLVTVGGMLINGILLDEGPLPVFAITAIAVWSWSLLDSTRRFWSPSVTLDGDGIRGSAVLLMPVNASAEELRGAELRRWLGASWLSTNEGRRLVSVRSDMETELLDRIRDVLGESSSAPPTQTDW